MPTPRTQRGVGSSEALSPDHIAVIGMACKFPGADSPEEYWQLLDRGQSMVTEPPEGRFPTREHSRSTDKSVFFGNFLSDVEYFDHRFFKKSSREAASMDPGQRDLDIGCFVGVCVSDYVDNVASHPPNAFSALGTLRAFLTGRISHFFGFTGPSITFDTACSSSAIAIDAACKAIRHGDCTSAIAGGVSIFTSPHLYQNLAAASFLSPTGATKSFDASADGYCRGEGVGLVVLKGLAQAIADGDNILGTILSTCVKQNSNKVPITVPHSPSHVALYRRALSLARIAPEDVSYLEAHGTGTLIGDPEEFEGIQEVFSSQARSGPLHFASVKGNIGHTEGASGVAGLIKTLLMIQKRAIPRQASHNQLNPKVKLATGQLHIPTETLPWTANPLIACISNHGAAGSIAAMVLRGPFAQKPDSNQNVHLSKYPLFVSGNSTKSLSEIAAKLRQYVSSFHPTSNEKALADLAFNLSEKQNHELPHILSTAVCSISELECQLLSATSDPSLQPCLLNPKPNPVVLIFGGQHSRSIGLSRDVYEGCTLLRKHLDECNQILRCFGHQGVYPAIFDSTPIDDVVSLQTMQFSLHYACAQSWIGCGLKIDCIVGHSFGQLVALSVSGILSLADGLKLIYDRAVLMRDKWGSERGSMIALDADRRGTLGLISAVQKIEPLSGLEIACYNGPRSHVLVGSAAEIDMVVQVINRSSAVRYKVLDVTHGFHSRFCDPLLPDLERVAGSLTYNLPKIHIETCSGRESSSTLTPGSIARYTRQPVYFEDAIKRIERRYGSCTWIEAGSNSSITSIARRSLSTTRGKPHLFCPLDLRRDDALGPLAETTANLWRNGHHIQFWPFHRIQRGDYHSLNLPPYQFERTLHWLKFNLVEDRPCRNQKASQVESVSTMESEPVFITFSGFRDSAQHKGVFTIDPRSDAWQTLVGGHVILRTPLCPAPLYIELALQAARELAGILNIPSTPYARLERLEVLSPLGISNDKIIEIFFTQLDTEGYIWNFAFESRGRSALDTAGTTAYATGKINLTLLEDSTVPVDFDRVGKLLQYGRFDEIALQPGVSAVQGSLIYQLFSRVVQYHDFYKGVRKVNSNEGTIFSQVSLPEEQPAAVRGLLCNPVAIDNFLQVPGLYVNCLASCAPDEVYICSHIDSVQLSSDFSNKQSGPWNVVSLSSRVHDRMFSNDVFAVEQSTNKLVFVAFGARFSKVRIASLLKTLLPANEQHMTGVSPNMNCFSLSKDPMLVSVPEKAQVGDTSNPQHNLLVPLNSRGGTSHATTQPINQISSELSYATTTTSETLLRIEDVEMNRKLREMLSKVTDVPAEQIEEHVLLNELGIDSLMSLEIASEVWEVFGVRISQAHLQDLQTFSSMSDYLHAHMARSTSGALEPPDDLASSVPATHFTHIRATDIPQSTYMLHNLQEPDRHQDLVSQLAGLLGNHLEYPASDIKRSTNLANLGLDSLICIELQSDIKRMLGVTVDLAHLTTASDFGELADIVLDAATTGSLDRSTVETIVTSKSSTGTSYQKEHNNAQNKFPKTTLSVNKTYIFSHAPRVFETVKPDFDILATDYGFAGFYDEVYRKNFRLVLAYTVEAFANLGVNLNTLNPGDDIPKLDIPIRHHRLREVLCEVIAEGKIAEYNGRSYVRTETLIDAVPSSVLFEDIVREFPQHAKEHMLLNLCGSDLASLMSGAKDPLTMLFGSIANRAILEDVYSSGSMYVIMSQLLTRFLEATLRTASPGPEGRFRIIEIGAGTGSTTGWVVDRLLQLGIPIEYTFTDISSALVSAGRRKFSKYGCMKYATINIEKEPPAQYRGQFDIVLATNCVHATSNLENSLRNINQLLRPHGFVSLIEFTSRMFWFDIVFGLLEGWWLFNDGRSYVLASPELWEECMKAAGFNHVSWTGGSTRESEVVRVITGFKMPVDDPLLYRSLPQDRHGGQVWGSDGRQR
ncbi:hypothetical protein F4677DRAFT_462253 [Hypoxylon crocopeplum]|nr:hypothetical protein F4677DRAFT_462253 [Hypoxylon crocopeplum]